MVGLKVTAAGAAFSDQMTVTFGSLADPSFHKRSLGSMEILSDGDFSHSRISLKIEVNPPKPHQ